MFGLNTCYVAVADAEEREQDIICQRKFFGYSSW